MASLLVTAVIGSFLWCRLVPRRKTLKHMYITSAVVGLLIAAAIVLGAL